MSKTQQSLANLSVNELWELRSAVSKQLIVARSHNQPKQRIVSMIAFAAVNGDFRSSLGVRPPLKVVMARAFHLWEQHPVDTPVEKITAIVIEAL